MYILACLKCACARLDTQSGVLDIVSSNTRFRTSADVYVVSGICSRRRRRHRPTCRYKTDSTCWRFALTAGRSSSYRPTSARKHLIYVYAAKSGTRRFSSLELRQIHPHNPDVLAGLSDTVVHHAPGRVHRHATSRMHWPHNVIRSRETSNPVSQSSTWKRLHVLSVRSG